MTKLIKTLSLALILNVTCAHSMEETKDSRLLLALPDEISITVIKCATNDDIFNTIKLLIKTSWICKKFKHLSEPNNIKAALCLNQKILENTLLHYALHAKFELKFDFTPFFKLLVVMGADTSCFSDLIDCIFTTNNTYLIEHYITNHKPDINIQDKDEYTPLRWTINLTYPNITKLLLEHGADMYIADKKGMTPTNEALLYDQVEQIKLFIQHGVDTSIEYNWSYYNGGNDHIITIAKWAEDKKNEEIYKLVTGKKLPSETCVIS